MRGHGTAVPRGVHRLAAALVVVLVGAGAARAEDAGAAMPRPQQASPEAGASEAGPSGRGGPDLGLPPEDPSAVDANLSLPSTAADGGTRDGLGPRDSGRGLPEWAPRLTASVKPAVAGLGDPITLLIKVRHGPGVSVNLPLKLELGAFSELSRSDSSRQIGKKGEMPETERIFTITVAAYELGEQTLPAVEVTALGPRGEMLSLSTTEMPIHIKGLQSNEPSPKLKDLEPPVTVFQRTYWLLYLLIGLAGAALVAAVTLIVSRRLRARRQALRPPPPPVPPEVLALERLATLDAPGLIARGEWQVLYLGLSEIMRAYAGGRWGFEALEMTTTEVNERLAIRRVETAVRQRLELFFNDCDLVKFARYRPEAEAAFEAVACAERLIRETTEFSSVPPVPSVSPVSPVPSVPSVPPVSKTKKESSEAHGLVTSQEARLASPTTAGDPPSSPEPREARKEEP